MKTNAQLLLLLIGIFFLVVIARSKIRIIPISNIDTDFPVTEKLEFKPFNKFDIFERGFCMIDDSILWSVEENEENFGFCYDLNTGKKLSTIASRGRAANELTELEDFQIIGDSVQLYAYPNMIKTFGKRDIIDNVPMGERKFTVTIVPDSIWVRRMVKLPNGFVLATLMPAFSESEKVEMNEFNQKSIAIFNNKEAKFYETINYESFDIGKAKDMELSANDLIKCAYADGSIEVKGNDMAVFYASNQFILYIFDVKNGKVVGEKRYTKMQREEVRSKTFASLNTMNEKHIGIESMKLNDKYILCDVKGYFSEEDKDSKLMKEAIFVFDWQLNPIKKFDLPDRKNGYYGLSNNGRSVYFCEFNEDGLTLYKADLNI